MQPRQIIHIRIRDLRRERELTQEELADALGISRQSVNAMEAGRCLPSLPVAMQMATYFAVPLAQLIDFLEENQQEAALQSLVRMGEGQRVASHTEDLPRLETTYPAVNLLQDEYSVVIEAALPGYRREQIYLDLGEDFIKISGESQVRSIEQFQYEFGQNSFSRTIALPTAVESDHAEATMLDGILTVRLQKKAQPQTKRLNIQAG